MYLNLYNFNVDGLYINRLIPDCVDNSFFDEWKKIQKDYMEEINAIFYNIPTFKIKWYEVDINGLKGLERIIEDSLGKENIFKILKTTENERFEKIESGYKLKVYVPSAEKTDFDLYESDSDIIIKIGNFKRNIPTPDVIRKYSISKAKFNEGYLEIYFEEKQIK
jgi:arsenite/tail-anchored protein-transporting ATPase